MPKGSCKPRLHQYPIPTPLPGKKGIGLLVRESASQELAILKSLNVHWNHRWSLSKTPGQPSSIEFVPLLWGAGLKENLTSITSKLNSNLLENVQNGTIKRLFAFNEPDSTVQSNMAPDWAAYLWPALESLGIPLGSPSCVSATGSWMGSFMGELDPACGRVDWIGVHWYGGTSLSSFQSSMRSIYNQYNRPIVITEFAPADWQATSPSNNRNSPAAVLNFMQQALPWLESVSWVAGYAWFPFSVTSAIGTSSALFYSDGRLTTLGKYYANF